MILGEILHPRQGKKGGSSAEIKKVRITVKEETDVSLRTDRNAFVIPGSIHHVEFFRRRDKKGQEKREAHFVSMLEAAQSKRDGRLAINKTHPKYPDAEYLFSLHPGEMMKGTFNDKEVVVVFTTGASTSKQMWFAEHTDARPSKITRKRPGFNARPNTLIASKVTIDFLGRLKPADA